MHGMIFMEMKKFADSFGQGTFHKLLKIANLEGKLYLPVSEYPDEELMRLVDAAAQTFHETTDITLEKFGEFITPDLMSMYKPLVDPSWKTLDMLLNTESAIHTVVRLQNPGAKPPQLRFERIAPNALRFYYASPRKMCSFAKGIIRGVAQYFKEHISIMDEKCMNKGDESCEIIVRTQ